jgi:hypothetical protein
MQDYTALCVVERERVTKRDLFKEEQTTEKLYSVRHIERFPLGTKYNDIANHVRQLFKRPELGRLPSLVVDATGVGLSVVEMLRGVRLTSVTITGGDQVRYDGRRHWVPKRDLVGVMQVLLHTERLKIAKQLKHAKTLTDELLNFRIKVTDAGRDTYEAWREGDHDDLVLSVALACWWGENGAKFSFFGGVLD